MISSSSDKIQKDKIRGCMIGGAVGDALGWPVEFKSEREIFNKYWPDGIKEFVLNPAGEAEITDDTQMALYTANGLLYGETQNLLRGMDKPLRQYVAVAYQDWLYTQEEGKASNLLPSGISWLNDVKGLFHRRAPGGTCLRALRLQNSAPGNIPDYINAELNESKGCGGIMRVAPIGLMNWHDIRALDYEGAQITAITHGHSLGYLPAAVLVHIINRIVYPVEGPQTLKSIIVEARDTVSELFKGDPFLPKLCSIINRAVDLAENSTESDLDNIHKLGEGWVAEETLGISLYCALRYQDDFSAGIIASVNHKGDSDSTGAVTGNILGALVGYEAVEGKWKEKLELRDVILEIADDLSRGMPVSENGECTDADWIRKYNRNGASRVAASHSDIRLFFQSGQEFDVNGKMVHFGIQGFYHREDRTAYIEQWGAKGKTVEKVLIPGDVVENKEKILEFLRDNTEGYELFLR